MFQQDFSINASARERRIKAVELNLPLPVTGEPRFWQCKNARLERMQCMKTVNRGESSATDRSKPSPQSGAGWARYAARICLMAVIVGFALPIQAQPWAFGGKSRLTFYQANAYIGSKYERVLSVDPTDVTNLIIIVTQIYGEILASDPPQRMAGLAEEIARTRPDLLGVEELWTLEKAIIPNSVGGPGPVVPIGGGGPGSPPGGGNVTPPQARTNDSALEFAVVYDYLQLLTNALAAKGVRYRVVVVTSEQDITMPMLDLQTGDLTYGRIIDHEAILVRADVPPGELRLSNARSGHFATYLEIPSFHISLPRGWCSVEVFTRGDRFKFICTHLEDEMAPEIQEAQGLELLNGPAKVSMPVMIVGDFNADPLHRTGTATYDEFTAAGFKDAWLTLHPNNPAGGLTWGHDSYLSDPNTVFNRRIDLVLYRGRVFAPTATAILDPRLNLSEPPLWPSDHAALVASFDLGGVKSEQEQAVLGRRYASRPETA